MQNEVAMAVILSAFILSHFVEAQKDAVSYADDVNLMHADVLRHCFFDSLCSAVTKQK